MVHKQVDGARMAAALEEAIVWAFHDRHTIKRVRGLLVRDTQGKQPWHGQYLVPLAVVVADPQSFAGTLDVGVEPPRERERVQAEQAEMEKGGGAKRPARGEPEV